MERPHAARVDSGEILALKKLDPEKLAVAFRERSLCTRSGTCVGICPEKAISLDDEFYPVILNPEKCTECGLCAEACPGGKVDYAELSQLVFDEPEDFDHFDGRVQESFVARAADDAMRAGGAGGGVITALLWDLLKHREVDGCIVTRMQPDKPWLGEPFIARSYEELMSSQGSRYSIIPVNSIFQEVLDTPGRYAYAALPCQTHGFRKAVLERPELGERIHSVVGLFCGGGLQPFLVPELLRTKRVKPNEIRDFQFRGGDWPGKMRAIMKDGSIRNMHYSNYRDGAYNYLTGIYMPFRCTTCFDGSCEFSDLSVSDAWTRASDGSYVFESHSRVIARTDLGVKILKQALERGTLIGHDVTEDPNYRTHKMQTRRKGINAPLRVERLGAKGIAVPESNRRAPADASRKERWTEFMITWFILRSRRKWFRYPLIKFLTSWAAVPLIKIRLFLKNRKYKKR